MAYRIYAKKWTRYNFKKKYIRKSDFEIHIYFFGKSNRNESCRNYIRFWNSRFCIYWGGRRASVASAIGHYAALGRERPCCTRLCCFRDRALRGFARERPCCTLLCCIRDRALRAPLALERGPVEHERPIMWRCHIVQRKRKPWKSSKLDFQGFLFR